MGSDDPETRLVRLCADDPFLREKAEGGPGVLRDWLLDERDACEAGRRAVLRDDVVNGAAEEIDLRAPAEPDWRRVAMAVRMLSARG